MAPAWHDAPTVERRGETFYLLPARAVFWPTRRALLVADLHWGKDATFRAHRIPLPEGPLAADLATLSALLEATRAEHIYVLGDLVHARPSGRPEVVEAVAAWREQWDAVEMTLVEGNHDRHLRQLPESWQIPRIAPPLCLGEIALVHEPTDVPGHFTWAGHLHPMWKLRERKTMLRLPCFAVGQTLGILPAFHPFTGGPVPKVGDEGEIFVVAEDAVVPLQANKEAPKSP